MLLKQLNCLGWSTTLRAVSGHRRDLTRSCITCQTSSIPTRPSPPASRIRQVASTSLSLMVAGELACPATIGRAVAASANIVFILISVICAGCSVFFPLLIRELGHHLVVASILAESLSQAFSSAAYRFRYSSPQHSREWIVVSRMSRYFPCIQAGGTHFATSSLRHVVKTMSSKSQHLPPFDRPIVTVTASFDSLR